MGRSHVYSFSNVLYCKGLAESTGTSSGGTETLGSYVTAIVPVNAPHPSPAKGPAFQIEQRPVSRFSELLKQVSLEGRTSQTASRTARAASLPQSHPFLPIRLLAAARSAQHRHGPLAMVVSGHAAGPLPKSPTQNSVASPLHMYSQSLLQQDQTEAEAEAEAETECDRGICAQNSSSLSDDSSAAASARNSAETMSSLALVNGGGGSKSNVSHLSETQLRVPLVFRAPASNSSGGTGGSGTRFTHDSLVDEGEGDLGSLERFCLCSTSSALTEARLPPERSSGVEFELSELSYANGDGVMSSSAAASASDSVPEPPNAKEPNVRDCVTSTPQAAELNCLLSDKEAADRQPLLGELLVSTRRDIRSSSPVNQELTNNHPNCARDPQPIEDLNFLTTKHPQNCFAFSCPN